MSAYARTLLIVGAVFLGGSLVACTCIGALALVMIRDSLRGPIVLGSGYTLRQFELDIWYVEDESTFGSTVVPDMSLGAGLDDSVISYGVDKELIVGKCYYRNPALPRYFVVHKPTRTSKNFSSEPELDAHVNATFGRAPPRMKEAP